MPMPTDNQINAMLRHVYTAGGTTLTIFAALAIIPSADVQPLLTALQQVGDGLHQAFGGASKIVLILGPVAAAFAAKAAATAASFKSQLKAVTATASAPAAKEEKVELAKATANVPGIVQVQAAPEIANATPDPKVVPVS